MPVNGRPKLYKALISWFVLAGIVGSLLSVTISSITTLQSVKELTFLSLTSSRDQQAQLINNWFEERAEDIRQLALSQLFEKEDLTGAKTLFANYINKLSSEFDSYFLAGKDGHVLIDATAEQSVLYVGDRSYFKEALEGEDTISEVLISRKDESPVVVVASPVYSKNGEITGVVFGTLSLAKIDKYISSFRFGETGETYLVDKRGIMLTESRFTPELIEKGVIKETTKYRLNTRSTLVDRVIGGETGFGEHSNYRGSKVLAAYRWIPERDWGLVIEIEKGEVLGSWFHKVSTILMALLVIIILVIFPIARHLSGRIVAPLTKITEKVKIFTENYKSDILSWSALESPGYQELAALSESFYLMGEKIRQLMDRLESQAQYDALTGLANRFHFFQRGRQIIELIQRNERTCSLIFLDIDKFKRINDTFGHAVGDEVLISLARMLERNVRISDVVGRLGGEEFTIILPDTDIEGAKMMAERLRKHIKETTIKAGDINLNITVSMGIAVYHGSKTRINGKEALENLVKKADAAMYKAKDKGRNCVEVYIDESTDKNQLKLFLDDED